MAELRETAKVYIRGTDARRETAKVYIRGTDANLVIERAYIRDMADRQTPR
jgi:hypothetical protein